jgi:hypothetical protein
VTTGSALSDRAAIAEAGAEMFSVEAAIADVSSVCEKTVVAARAVNVKATEVRILVAFI